MIQIEQTADSVRIMVDGDFTFTKSTDSKPVNFVKYENGTIGILEDYVPPKILETGDDLLSYTRGVSKEVKESMRFIDVQGDTWRYDSEQGWGFIFDGRRFMIEDLDEMYFPMIRIK